MSYLKGLCQLQPVPNRRENQQEYTNPQYPIVYSHHQGARKGNLHMCLVQAIWGVCHLPQRAHKQVHSPAKLKTALRPYTKAPSPVSTALSISLAEHTGVSSTGALLEQPGGQLQGPGQAICPGNGYQAISVSQVPRLAHTSFFNSRPGTSSSPKPDSPRSFPSTVQVNYTLLVTPRPIILENTITFISKSTWMPLENPMDSTSKYI